MKQRAASPLFDIPMLVSGGMALGLAGALLAYMVLFGPLMLFPQVRAAWFARTQRTTRQAAKGTALLAVGAILCARRDRLRLPGSTPARRRCRTTQ